MGDRADSILLLKRENTNYIKRSLVYGPNHIAVLESSICRIFIGASKLNTFI